MSQKGHKTGKQHPVRFEEVVKRLLATPPAHPKRKAASNKKRGQHLFIQRDRPLSLP
jgi:hypothetical protein